MRLVTLAVAASSLMMSGPADTPITGGAGAIYFASYARRIAIIDEATGEPTAEIPLQTGLAWAMRLSSDATRFYVQSADQEHFEVVDLASRTTLDTFTLSDGNAHVRALAYDVDPQNRMMVLVARSATKLVDRFEIGPPTFIQYDLREHKIVRMVPWTADPEPQYYYLHLRFSPDGKLLYVFANEIVIYDAATLSKVDAWDFSLPNEPAIGRFDLSSMDETHDEPGFFTALFTIRDPVQKRRILVVGRADLGRKRIDFFPIGPAPGEHEEVSFALAPDRKHGYVLLEDIGRYELWTLDMTGRKFESRVSFKARPRMALRSSSNGRILYIYEAGNTIDLYQADGFKYLRTITVSGDMMYNTFHVVPPRPERSRTR